MEQKYGIVKLRDRFSGGVIVISLTDIPYFADRPIIDSALEDALSVEYPRLLSLYREHATDKNFHLEFVIDDILKSNPRFILCNESIHIAYQDIDVTVKFLVNGVDKIKKYSHYYDECAPFELLVGTMSYRVDKKLVHPKENYHVLQYIFTELRTGEHVDDDEV